MLSVLVIFGFAMFSGCAAKKVVKGETAGEYIDDSTVTAKANVIIVKDPDAQYLKIDVTTTQGDVVLQGFVNNKKTEKRIVKKIKGIRGVKSVKSSLRIEEKK